MSEILGYLIPVAALLSISLASALTKQEAGEHYAEHFTISIFFLTLSIGIAIFIWQGVFPLYTIIFAGVTFAGIWFSPENSGVSGA